MKFEICLLIMLVFPNCKINLGLHVINKRDDGFHNIETVFYPVGWTDALEVIEAKDSENPFTYTQSGLHIEGSLEQNLIYKAWKIISQEKKIPALKVHLHKNIPMGAGLGGGSSDAAHFINLLNDKFKLGYTIAQRLKLAAQLGSDCGFFIENTPVLAEEKGNKFSKIGIDLSAYYILIVYPGIHSNTSDAYSGLSPKKPQHYLADIIKTNTIENWKNVLVNDFETSIFKKYSEIKLLKDNLYTAGALYSCLSGSGSSVFGIFNKLPELNFPTHYHYYLQKPSHKIL